MNWENIIVEEMVRCGNIDKTYGINVVGLIFKTEMDAIENILEFNAKDWFV